MFKRLLREGPCRLVRAAVASLGATLVGGIPAMAIEYVDLSNAIVTYEADTAGSCRFAAEVLADEVQKRAELALRRRLLQLPLDAPPTTPPLPGD